VLRVNDWWWAARGHLPRVGRPLLLLLLLLLIYCAPHLQQHAPRLPITWLLPLLQLPAQPRRQQRRLIGTVAASLRPPPAAAALRGSLLHEIVSCRRRCCCCS
jgi:hypothetical protein